jgi:hypothetical protein
LKLAFSLITNRAEIPQALLSQFSRLAEFLLAKVPDKDKDRRVLLLVNHSPGYHLETGHFFATEYLTSLVFGCSM